MRYESYKKLKNDFNIIKSFGYRPKTVVTLNNGHKIKGYLLNVNSNHLTILKLNGKTISLSYTKIKKVLLIGLPKKILNRISDKIII